MTVLLDHLMVLTRIEAGQLPLECGPVDIAQIVGTLQEDVSPQLAARGLGLTVSIPSNLPPVHGDATRVQQILLNLLDNAIKFTERGTISLRASATKQDVVIAVSDPGVGIAPDVLPFVFEEFWQGDETLTQKYGGAGLGLVVSQRLATQMQGQLTVVSRQGRGSTFTLQLPVDPAARSARKPQAKSGPLPPNPAGFARG
jgi:signal transduction histidine kinase